MACAFCDELMRLAREKFEPYRYHECAEEGVFEFEAEELARKLFAFLNKEEATNDTE